MLTRPVDQRSFEVQQYTGYPTSRHAAGNWDRGILYRQYTAEVRPSGRELYMYDPTNPLTWNNANY